MPYLIFAQSSFCFRFISLETSIKTNLVIIFKKELKFLLFPHRYLHIHLNHHFIHQKCKIFPKVLIRQDYLLHFEAMFCNPNFILIFHFLLKVFLTLSIYFILTIHPPFIHINPLEFLLLLPLYLHFQPTPQFFWIIDWNSIKKIFMDNSWNSRIYLKSC